MDLKSERERQAKKLSQSLVRQRGAVSHCRGITLRISRSFGTEKISSVHGVWPSDRELGGVSGKLHVMKQSLFLWLTEMSFFKRQINRHAVLCITVLPRDSRAFLRRQKGRLKLLISAEHWRAGWSQKCDCLAMLPQTQLHSILIFQSACLAGAG